MKEQRTFEEVLLNNDDKVIVRELLVKYIPRDIQDEIVRQYNRAAREKNALRANLGLEEW